MAEHTTKQIKERLRAYTRLLRELDNQQERYDRLLLTYGQPHAPSSSGMPHGPGGISDRVSMEAEKKMQLEAQIDRTREKERRENAAIEELLALLDDPDERAVIRLKYFDRVPWDTVTAALFGAETDYLDRLAGYQKRVYKLHGRALLNLAKIERGVKGSKRE